MDFSVRDSIFKCTLNPSNPINRHYDQVPNFLHTITFTLEKAEKTEIRGIVLLFPLTSALDGKRGGQYHVSAALQPGKETPFTVCKVNTQDQSRRHPTEIPSPDRPSHDDR